MKSVKLFLVLLCLPAALQATTIKWLVRPAYDYIVFYSEDLFKCVKEDKVQLIDFEGKVLLPFAVDSVTDYSDGYALLLDKDGKRYRVRGVFSEKNHDCQTVDGIYYTERYTYCSEGFVSVADTKGKQGYIDVKGYPVIRCQFREARPFRKGWASVSEEEGEAHYIDKSGSILHVSAQLTDASSFNQQGEALVGNYQKLLIINTSGEIVRKYKMKIGQTEPPVRPYDYVFDEKWTSFQLEYNQLPNLRSSYTVFADQGQYGIGRNGLIVSFPQFDEVQEVTEHYAVVRKEQGFGIVAFVEGEFQSAVEPSEVFVVPGKGMDNCIYHLSVPNGLENLTLMFDCGDGEWQATRLENPDLQFRPHIGITNNSCTIRAAVMSDDLLLWQDEKTLYVRRAQVEVEVGQPYCTSLYANDNDLQRAKAIVTNRSAFPVEVSTAFDTMLPSGSRNKVVSRSNPSMMLQPDETMECVITFRVVKEEKVKVTVSATSEGQTYGSSEAIITLRPFY